MTVTMDGDSGLCMWTSSYEAGAWEHSLNPLLIHSPMLPCDALPHREHLRHPSHLGVAPPAGNPSAASFMFGKVRIDGSERALLWQICSRLDRKGGSSSHVATHRLDCMPWANALTASSNCTRSIHSSTRSSLCRGRSLVQANDDLHNMSRRYTKVWDAQACFVGRPKRDGQGVRGATDDGDMSQDD